MLDTSNLDPVYNGLVPNEVIFYFITNNVYTDSVNKLNPGNSKYDYFSKSSCIAGMIPINKPEYVLVRSTREHFKIILYEELN